MSNELPLPDCVGNGARFFDQFNPDWFKTIDLDALDMWNPSTCIYGQLFGSFHNMPKPLKNNPFKFGLWSNDLHNTATDNHSLLAHAWRDQILHRLHS